MNAKPLWIYKGNLQEQFQSYPEAAEEKDFIQLCQAEAEPTMLLPAIHFYGFLLACIFTKSYLAFKNDATEILYSHVVKPAAASPSSNSTMNQARNGGRHYTSAGSDRNSEYPTGGAPTASRSPSALRRRGAPAAAPPGPAPGAEPPPPGRGRSRSRSRSRGRGAPLQRASPPRRRPASGAPGNRRLGEAGAREDAAGARPGPASPGGPRASLPPPCESCRTGSLGQVTSRGRFTQERRVLRVIRQGSTIKERAWEAFPKPSLSELALPLRAGEVSGLLFKRNKKRWILFPLLSFTSCCSTYLLNTSSRSKQISS